VEIALINLLVQAILFTIVVCIPIYKTGRMSYVDIAWPWGLVLLGIISFIFSDGYWVRSLLVSGMVILVGLRMGLGAVKMWRSGYLEKELSRYEYQHIRWKKKGKDNTQLALQVDAISQGLANASFLALPIFITATNTQQSFGPVEILGICIWGVALLMESIADFQKLAFLKRMKKEEKRNQVCNVGLWKYSRHPNYFAEWMVWNGLVITALPSWLALKDIQSEIFNDQVDQILWLLLGAGLIYVSRMMYLTLVYATGAIPAEHYSAQKRPGYKEYQKTTNRFFPGPPK
jgi:steroid 5-alpha reductase family enzyme